MFCPAWLLDLPADAQNLQLDCEQTEVPMPQERRFKKELSFTLELEEENQVRVHFEDNLDIELLRGSQSIDDVFRFFLVVEDSFGQTESIELLGWRLKDLQETQMLVQFSPVAVA